MKGDREGKMNTVEKQCVVHVYSRPAIVGTSESVTLLIRISFFTSKALSSLYTFGRLTTSCMMFSSGTPPWSVVRASLHRNCSIPTSAKADSTSIRCAGEPLYSPRNSYKSATVRFHARVARSCTPGPPASVRFHSSCVGSRFMRLEHPRISFNTVPLSK